MTIRYTVTPATAPDADGWRTVATTAADSLLVHVYVNADPRPIVFTVPPETDVLALLRHGYGNTAEITAA